MISISDLGFRWKGVYSPNFSYSKGDVVWKDGGAHQFTNGVFIPMALGQQNAPQLGALVGGHSVPLVGKTGQLLFVRQDGTLEWRYPDERSSTAVLKLASMDGRGDTGGYKSYRHYSALMTDGTVRSWGNEENGYQGNGQESSRGHSLPNSVAFPYDAPKMVELIKGSLSTYAIDENGGLWVWGHNNYGQLGVGNTSNVKVPVKISGYGDLPSESVEKVVKVATGDSGYYGYRCTIVVTDAGNAYHMGSNNYYCGGTEQGNTSNNTTPRLVKRSEDVNIVDAWCWGHYHTATWLLDDQGRLWGAGEQNSIGRINNNGNPDVRHQLWTPSEEFPVKMVRGEESDRHDQSGSQYYRKYAIVTQDGRLYSWGHSRYGTQVPNSEEWTPTYDTRLGRTVVDVIVSAGYYDQIMALDNTGEVWGIGYGGYNSLGNGDSSTWRQMSTQNSRISNIVKIQGGGSNHRKSFTALDADGRAISWGTNDNGAAGNGYSYSSGYTYDYCLIPERIVDFQMGGYWAHDYYRGTTYWQTETGRILSSGYGGNAALGNEDDDEYHCVPTPVMF